MSTSIPGAIGRRTLIVGPDRPEFQVSKDEWNAQLVVQGEALDGSLMIRDRAHTDGWALAETIPEHVGVPPYRTINGYPLSSNVWLTKADLGLGNVENIALSTWTGSTSLTILGTISTGTWQGSLIQPMYGGTGSPYVRFDGPTELHTYTLPDEDARIFTWNDTLPPSLGGTGVTTGLEELDASNLTSGIVPDERLSGNVARTDIPDNIPWDAVDKTGSSLADLDIRSAADLNTGILAVERLPPEVVLYPLDITDFPPHAPSHQAFGADPLKLDSLEVPDDTAKLNASTSYHGLLPKLTGDATHVLNGRGEWVVGGGGGGGQGDVIGVGTSVVGNLPMYWDATGKAITDSGIKLSSIALVDQPNTWTADQNFAGSVAIGGGLTVDGPFVVMDGIDAAQLTGTVPLAVLPAHAPTHQAGGSDELALDTLGAPSDITALNATTAAHGLLHKLSGSPLHYLDGTGVWSVPGQPLTDEVWIGPDDPGVIEYELWYDTDEWPPPIIPDPHAFSHSEGGSDPILITQAQVDGLAATLATKVNNTDPRLSDARTPLLHHTTHHLGGSDPIKLDALALPDDTLNLNASTTAHGLLPKLNGSGSYFLSGLGTWRTATFLSGTLAQQPTGLTAADAGLLYMVLAPYFHLCRWSGSVWEFAPGDCGSGWFAMRAVVPQEGGWQRCDGGATDYLKVGGTTLTAVAFTTPNLTTGTYLVGWSGYDGVIYPAVEQSLSGGISAAGAHGHPAAGAHGHTAWTDAQGDHYHTGTVDGNGAHAHGVSGVTDQNGDHSHGMSGPSNSRNADAGSSFGAAESNHSHTIFNGGQHAHNWGGNTDSQGWHQHNFGTNWAGNHGHNVGVSVAPDHTHGGVGDHVHGHTLALSGATHPQRLVVHIYFRR